MTHEPRDTKMDELARGLVSMRDYLANLSPEQRQHFPELVERLQTTVEELHVAQGELQSKNDHLRMMMEELHLERERYRDLFNAAPDGYLVTNLEGTILEANDLIQSMLNVRKAHLQGKPLILFLAPASRPEVMRCLALFREAAADLQLHGFDAALNPRDLGPVNVAIRASMVHGDANHPRAVRWLMRDITERYRQELMISALNAELEARVRERTAQLDAAIKKAHAASDAKDHFLAALSHELRTPLTPVVLAVMQLERDEHLPAETRQQLTTVLQHIELETRLIDDLLDVSRIARGKIQLRKTAVSLNDILRQAVSIVLHPHLIEDKAIKVLTHFEATSDGGFGDPARLTQLFCNLLQNALKFTPRDGTITIRTTNSGQWSVASGQSEGAETEEDAEQEEAESAVTWQLTVTDTGIGIPEKNIVTLFDVFEQGGPSITQRYGGLGLGLAISKAIVELHHGSIQAASPGTNLGATFTIFLPTAQIRVPAARSLPLPTWNGKPLVKEGSQRILLVEDHEPTARALQKVLQRMGFVVEVADCVSEAMTLAGKESHDLIISDLGLPDGTGAELLQAVHTLLPPPAVPAICLSGYGSDRDLAMTAEAGFSRHLIKPINIDELATAIQQVLRLPAMG